MKRGDVEPNSSERGDFLRKLKLQTCALRELLYCYDSKLSVKDIWNLDGGLCPHCKAHAVRDPLRGEFPERLRMRAEYDRQATLPIVALPIDIKDYFSGKHKRAQVQQCA